jgi:putative peptidoglycan lipid II flippase
VGTALLPILARRIAAGDDAGACHYVSRSLEFSLALGVPAAVALVVAAEPIIAVLFERGAFGPAETLATSRALAAYALGIPAYVIVKVLSAAHFARQDTMAPVKVAIIVTLANACLAIALIWGGLAHVGIALATGLTAWLNVLLLARGLRRRRMLELDARLRQRAPGLILAALVMGGVLLISVLPLAPWLGAESTMMRFFGLSLLVGIGGASFLGTALASGGMNFAELRGLMKRARA